VKNDDDITSLNTHITLAKIEGPITRACARQLNLEVSSFLSMSLYVTLAFGPSHLSPLGFHPGGLA
jgi:hypothetical protein